jgi:hypothetical protein
MRATISALTIAYTAARCALITPPLGEPEHQIGVTRGFGCAGDRRRRDRRISERGALNQRSEILFRVQREPVRKDSTRSNHVELCDVEMALSDLQTASRNREARSHQITNRCAGWFSCPWRIGTGTREFAACASRSSPYPHQHLNCRHAAQELTLVPTAEPPYRARCVKWFTDSSEPELLGRRTTGR